ncbi:AraC family transcriptional regulator [Flammeovirga kamogawensis]|uniref:AraC family transcriptional regulator n=2 Tax=Flammeovirga kamogawensis TaxID=373891 RepID=A0ABX8H536_9BACT|nr:AraC family transcriptional regulator [Flammeovirga kamogawensis]TRX65683.1 AraC family transcriptional regulator [Flammeovirga kamogawensis]
MKLVFKNSDSQVNRKIEITKRTKGCQDETWHYHHQYELIYIVKSQGVRFVGDNVSPFDTGDLVLVGPNLPHLWKDEIVSGSDDVEIIVIKFEGDFIGKGTFDRPVFNNINHLLELSRFGVCFPKAQSLMLKDEIENLVNLSLAEQVIKLLGLLNKLSEMEGKEILSTSDMRQNKNCNSERIDRVLSYVSDHYDKDIDLQEIADIACLTTNSFCRFFKKSTKKSFRQYLNEVRIKNASRLLIQENYQISDVCYEVGFNSITNFNKQFKQIIGKTPKEYRMAI